MSLLVDSSVWVWTLGQNVKPRMVDYISMRTSQEDVFTTGMVRLEVMIGATTWNQLLDLQLFFADLNAIEPTSDTWDEASRRSLRMKSRGFTLRAQDLLIASVALENNLTLVHADRDFDPLAENEGLKTESLLHLIE